MNGVIGLTDFLFETEADDERREYLSMVKNSADGLLAVINDILDFSKIEAGHMELEETDFSLRDTLGSLLKPLAFRARCKDLELVCHIGEGVPDRLRGDPVRLRQVVVNLVGNALKFTEQGEIAARVEVETQDDSRVVLHVRVSDTGIGIPPDKTASIFREFEQADGAANRPYGGTGLGLSISARLVEMMQGRIWVDSVPGQGSTFHFTAAFGWQPGQVPGRRGTSPVAVRWQEDPGGQAWGLRILVAEDNRVNQTLAGLLLRKRGHEVTFVETGLAAVERLERETFDLVLMDVQMPVMDGFEATRLIRQRESGGRRTPVVAMTAHVLKSDRGRCLEAGMDGYVSKPIAADDLYQAIEDGVAAAARHGRPAATGPQSAPDLPEPGPPRPAAASPALGVAPPAQGDAPAAAACASSVDWSLARSRIGGDEAALHRVVRVFLEEEKAVRQRLNEALAADDADELRRHAHSLKGTLGLFGVQHAGDVALRLEMIGKQRALEQVPPVIRELECELASIVPELEALLRQPPPPHRTAKRRWPDWAPLRTADPV